MKKWKWISIVSLVGLIVEIATPTAHSAFTQAVSTYASSPASLTPTLLHPAKSHLVIPSAGTPLDLASQEPPVNSAESGSHLQTDATREENSKPAPIRLWRDAVDDLWVATPSYVWNITGGSNITIIGDGVEYEWFVGEHTNGHRVIDGLFLSARPETPTTSQIVFALFDEALVYLERTTPDGVEGLELSFRASDGLIRLTHRWQGEGVPTDTVTHQPTLTTTTPHLLELDGTLPANKPTPDGYDYSARFDPATHQGYAWLQRPEEISSLLRPSQTSCPVQPGASMPTAYDPCRFPNFFLPGRVLGRTYLLLYSADPAAPLEPVHTLIAALQLALPDLDAAYIARTPRYDYDAPKNQPAPGDMVTFTAHVANRGGEASGVFTYTWRIDGAPTLSAAHPSLAPSETLTLTLDWTWQTGIHEVRFELDPSNLIPEVSEQNNVVEDRTNALAVGFWAEQSVYDYFNLHQVELGLGSVSWDDWAQRQVRVWNQMFADAIHPLTPYGVLDRVRLDKVTVTPDGALPNPYPSNFPDINDRTIDMQWGFASESVGVPSTHPQYGPFYLLYPEALNVEYSLMHELSHARYLIDLYGLNVVVGAMYLSSGVDSITTTLHIDRDVDGEPSPAYLSIKGELVICQSKAGDAFTACVRGAEGTTPRPHASDILVNRATVRLQDGQGNLVQGSPALPIVSAWDDHIYYNRYPDDLMSGGVIYEQHSAFAWNRIAGQRPLCGNYNAPCNIGEYLNDIPQHNILEIRGEDGQPLPGAQVQVFRASSFSGWYGKTFLNKADAVHLTDSQGRVDLGPFPFGDNPPIIHTYGLSNADILLKISSGNEDFYRFFEVTETNEAYWFGHRDTAIYVLRLGVIGPRLHISKAGPTSATSGEPITFTLTVNNTGSTTATNLVITDAIPSRATYVSGGTRASNVVSWTLPGLEAGASASVQFVVTATQTITNDDYGVIADGGIAARGDVPVVVARNIPLAGVVISGPVTGTLDTLRVFTATVSPITATQPVNYVWQARRQSSVTHVGGLSDTVSFSWDTPGIQFVTVTAQNIDSGNTVTATHIITTYTPPHLVTIHSVNPSPPQCVLRDSPDLDDRLIELKGEKFSITGQDNLQFRKVSNGDTSIHFHSEVNWASPTRVMVDIGLINHLLWPDSKVILEARFTRFIDGVYQPTSDWSPQFILADDAVACSIQLAGVSVSGPVAGIVGADYVFTATVNPLTATLPITYAWQATGQTPVTNTGGLSDAFVFTWAASGTQYITVTATNVAGVPVSDTHTIIVVNVPLDDVSISGPTKGLLNVLHVFTATTTPSTATLPLTYTWSPAPDSGQGTETVTYTWATTGPQTIAVTATNAAGVLVSYTHTIVVNVPLDGVTIAGPTKGEFQKPDAFTATTSPPTATLPITYTWSPAPDSGQGTETVTYTWAATGPQTIAVTATNAAGVWVSYTHTIIVNVPLDGVTIAGPTKGEFQKTDAFTATTSPPTATLPITYTWSPAPDSGQGTETVTYTWAATGPQMIVVTATNASDIVVSDTHTIVVNVPLDDVIITGPTEGLFNIPHVFTATTTPSTATLPLTYTWSPAPDGGQGTETATYTWTATGPQMIVVTATNAADVPVSSTHTIVVTPASEIERYIYLPIVSRNFGPYWKVSEDVSYGKAVSQKTRR